MALEAVNESFAHLQAGRPADAERVCQALLRANSSDPNAWRLYGFIAQAVGQTPVAIDAFARAMELAPRTPEFAFTLGNALRIAGRLEDAIAVYQRALGLKPDYSDALVNLGLCQNHLGRESDAIDSWEAALALNGNDVDALVNLGNLHRAKGRISQAVELLERALGVDPRCVAALANLAGAHLHLGRWDDALVCHRRAMELSPGAMAHSTLLMNLVYRDDLPPEELLQEHRAWNALHAVPLKQLVQPHGNDRTPDRRLRIGYLSPDFRDHSVAFFLEPILAGHRSTRVEVFCYATSPIEDAVTARLRRHGHTWRNLFGLGDAQAAEMIRADAIDILIDLALHTSGSRLTLFALKPAPVQATWLGYAFTTGLDAIDWRITDALVDPPGQTEAFHSERLMRLPRTQWCYTPPTVAPEVGELPATTHPGTITFGNATNLAKITPTTLDLWAGVLRAVPSSRLMLKAGSLTDSVVRGRLIDAFASRGINADRLTLEPAGDLVEYLRFFSRIDIALDTFPFAGGTTTCHALWMGVPMVTLVGRASLSRVGASVLTNVGLGDLITDTPEQFITIATRLAGDVARLADLRQTLRQRMRSSALCDAGAFIEDLETAYQTMWRDWCDRTPGG